MTAMRYLLAGVTGSYIPLAVVSTATAQALWFVWALLGAVLVAVSFVRSARRDRPRR